ncbi:hypothetical protein HYC85_008355 [Camellia sinensis]|uniref:Uncharacterized protein n=1 Tax=Camellia sinensis TaxID=4442 RepID=A0A7J7HSB5_CAMSI|nr:hypothetical protein HYC85_008355 [Camellia sinensis]
MVAAAVVVAVVAVAVVAAAAPTMELRYIAMHRYRNVEALVLGFQHYIMTLGTTVLIPTMLRRLRFLTPLSMVPLITFTGLGFCYLGFSMLAKCVEVGLPELILMAIFSQANSKLEFNSIIDMGSCILIHIPCPFQWGRPTFNAGEAFAMMVASIVASIESTSTFLATARYGSATPVPASILSRGVGWLGFGTAGWCIWLGDRAYCISFNDIVTVIFTSHATVAALVAVLLDCTLSREDDVARKDSGSQWWEKFIFYNADMKELSSQIRNLDSCFAFFDCMHSHTCNQGWLIPGCEDLVGTEELALFHPTIIVKMVCILYWLHCQIPLNNIVSSNNNAREISEIFSLWKIHLRT